MYRQLKSIFMLTFTCADGILHAMRVRDLPAHKRGCISRENCLPPKPPKPRRIAARNPWSRLSPATISGAEAMGL